MDSGSNNPMQLLRWFNLYFCYFPGGYV